MNEKLVTQRNVPLVVSIGLGINSMAMLIGMQQRGIRPDLCVFADTGGEKPETIAYAENWLKPWLKEVNFPQLITVKNHSPLANDKSLENECRRKDQLPSRAFGYSSCAEKWKIRPQNRHLKEWLAAQGRKGTKVIKALGIDAGESHRAKVHTDNVANYWYPLVEWDLDREDCEELILSVGLPLPPKSACFFCPSSKKTEVLRLATEHPELMKRALVMEQAALNNTEKPLQKVKGLGRHWSWAEVLTANGETLASLRESPVEPCFLCQD